jgi:single-strand DNA-binding protein
MYSKITIVGNLGRDPEMRFTPQGQPVTSFSVASNRRYTSGGGEQASETTWFRVTFWGKQAENCNQYLHKGSKVYIEGRLTPDKSTGGPRVWEKEGKANSSFEVNGQMVIFLDTRSEGGGSSGDASQPDEEDLPF